MGLVPRRALHPLWLGARRGLAAVIVIGVGAALPACKKKRDDAAVAPPAAAAAEAPEAPTLLDPARATKLAVIEAFLADVDVTLHGMRLDYQGPPGSLFTWDWPSWLPEETARTRLGELTAVLAAPPDLGALDDAAEDYVTIVRPLLSTLGGALSAWETSVEAFAPHRAPLLDAFERLGAASQALRAQYRAVAPPAPSSGWQVAAHACLAGGDLVARAAPLGRAVPAAPEPLAEAPEPPAEAEAEAPPPSVYLDNPSPAAFRAVGVACLRAVVDFYERDAGDDQQVGSVLSYAVSAAMHLIGADARRRNTEHGYVTTLGNYAQVSAYLARLRLKIELPDAVPDSLR